MINITPDLEQFSLGEPGGSVSMKPNASSAKKAPAKKAPAKAVAKASSCKCACKKTSGKKSKEPAAGSAFPALDAGPSGPMFGGGMFMDGPSGPMFDGPSGPMR